MMKQLLLFTLLVPVGACADDPAHFEALCIVKAVRNMEEGAPPVSWVTPCRVDDLPDVTKFNNRFGITFLDKAPEKFSMPPIADYVKAEATRGMMVVKSLFWGEVTVVPYSPAIQKRFNFPSAFEIRPQRLSLQPHEGKLQLLITEPHADYGGPNTLPSAQWQEDFLNTTRLLSRAK